MKNLLVFFLFLSCQFQSPVTSAQDISWSQDRIRQILDSPTSEEVADIVESWKINKKSTEKIELVESGQMIYGEQEFLVSVYKHLVDKEEHYTAIYVPAGVLPESLPILVEARGVRYDYPPRKISKGSFVMSILGDMIGEFIIVEPCLRGHQLQAIKKMHQAAGDRRDSWDGATNDVIAAVSVAISEIPAWDKKNIFSFGVSRGGGVALLHGQRDKRVTGVIAMSAPTDWTKLMARPDEDWGNRIYEAAKNYDEGSENDRSKQFHEWFLQDRHQLSNREIRRRLIASSPLFFVEHLPPTLVHQGTSDYAIPSVNAAALNDWFYRLGLSSESYRVIFHEGAGHLLKGSRAAEQSREFLKALIDK